jgi:hypothetical protein
MHANLELLEAAFLSSAVVLEVRCDPSLVL